ncbi:sensor histidine kinase [Nonomuraea sp. NPDC050328]|uniref:sensor histidine kinase n=1 Tax=Nonomuraea sp. NPDC050328 TaxID=3364361 RepID=UPI0037B8BC48
MNARSWAVDALLAAAICLLTLGPGQVLPGGPGVLALQAGLTVPLAWRRRAPVAVFGVIAAVAAVQWLAGVRLPADVALLVALYTVAATAAWPYPLVASAVTGVGVVLASVRWAPEGRVLLSVVALAAMAGAAVAAGLHQRTRRGYLTALERDRDQRARLAVAEDRARMARDLHDIVTHNLSVMVALADSAHYVRDSAPQRAAAAVSQIAETGRQALADMRRSLAPGEAGERAGASGPGREELRPAPGLAELPGLADRVRGAGLAVDLQVRGPAGQVPAGAQLTVYRLVQEALTNTLKHAPPQTRAEIRIGLSPGAVTVDIVDDGPAGQRPGAGGGYGLKGMRDRVAAYGGTFRAGPRAAGGWQVTARLDLRTGDPEDVGRPDDAGVSARAGRA